MASSTQEDDDRPGSWKRSMYDAREQARAALAECSGPHIDNWQSVEAPNVVQYLHAQTLDYYRHIAPKAEEIDEERWNDPLLSVSVPETQTIEVGMTNWYGDYELDDVLSNAKWVDKPVVLASLRDDWQKDATAAIEIVITDRATRTETREYRQYDLTLPPAACEAILGALDECLEELGWLPEVTGETPRTQIDDDLIQEVKRWQKQNL